MIVVGVWLIGRSIGRAWQGLVGPRPYGRTDISVKTEFKPRVTLGGILSEQNLELLMGHNK